MPFAAIAGGIATAAGASALGVAAATAGGAILASQTGGISGMLGGGGGGGGGSSAPQGGYSGGSGNGFIPPNINAAANSALSNTGDLYNLAQNYYNTVAPWAQNAFQEAANNPYADSAQQAAAYTAALQGQFGQNQLQIGQQVQSVIPGLQGAAGQVLNTAFDPQQALYNRTLNQVEQQQNAQQAARGLAMSPVGAELSNQAVSNFNIDWQNQQLARQMQGLAAAGNAYGMAGQIGTMGANMGQLGANNMTQAALLPANTYNSLLSQQLQNVGIAQNSYMSGLNALYNMNQPYFQYMGLGNAGASAAVNSAAMNYQQQQNAYGPLTNAIGQGVQGIINNWPSSSGGSSDYAPVNTSLGLGFYNPTGYNSSYDPTQQAVNSYINSYGTGSVGSFY